MRCRREERGWGGRTRRRRRRSYLGEAAGYTSDEARGDLLSCERGHTQRYSARGSRSAAKFLPSRRHPNLNACGRGPSWRSFERCEDGGFHKTSPLRSNCYDKCGRPRRRARPPMIERPPQSSPRLSYRTSSAPGSRLSRQRVNRGRANQPEKHETSPPARSVPPA